MPITDLKLPSEDVVKLIYGAIHEGPGTKYLNAVSMGMEASAMGETIRSYFANVDRYANQLAAEILEATQNFDAVISPPSSRQDVAPYKSAALQRKIFTNGSWTRDVSARLTRKGKVKIGGNQTSLDQAIEELVYQPVGDESNIKSLLIIDESVASGRTFAAILHHLKASGLSIECQVTCAAWARMPATSKSFVP